MAFSFKKKKKTIGKRKIQAKNQRFFAYIIKILREKDYRKSQEVFTNYK